VLLGGGDICFGTTTPSQFAARFRAGMDALFAASPNSRVLVASIFNLESIRAAVLQRSPGYRWSFCGFPFFNASDADRALLMDRVVAYNGVLASECATYANCLYDGNALFNHVWTPGEVSTVDNVHPSAAGEEMIAEVLYNAGYRWDLGDVKDKDACKNGGWVTAHDNLGRSFKNQGDCVSYVATKGTNGANG
jgi:lysophospholipase L1-like esterase